MAKPKDDWEDLLIVEVGDLDVASLRSPASVALEPPEFPIFELPLAPASAELARDTEPN
jgi:hypothetical protein